MARCGPLATACTASVLLPCIFVLVILPAPRHPTLHVTTTTPSSELSIEDADGSSAKINTDTNNNRTIRATSIEISRLSMKALSLPSSSAAPTKPIKSGSLRPLPTTASAPPSNADEADAVAGNNDAGLTPPASPKKSNGLVAAACDAVSSAATAIDSDPWSHRHSLRALIDDSTKVLHLAYDDATVAVVAWQAQLSKYDVVIARAPWGSHDTELTESHASFDTRRTAIRAMCNASAQCGTNRCSVVVAATEGFVPLEQRWNEPLAYDVLIIDRFSTSRMSAENLETLSRTVRRRIVLLDTGINVTCPSSNRNVRSESVTARAPLVDFLFNAVGQWEEEFGFSYRGGMISLCRTNLNGTWTRPAPHLAPPNVKKVDDRDDQRWDAAAMFDFLNKATPIGSRPATPLDVIAPLAFAFHDLSTTVNIFGCTPRAVRAWNDATRRFFDNPTVAPVRWFVESASQKALCGVGAHNKLIQAVVVEPRVDTRMRRLEPKSKHALPLDDRPEHQKGNIHAAKFVPHVLQRSSASRPQLATPGISSDHVAQRYPIEIRDGVPRAHAAIIFATFLDSFPTTNAAWNQVSIAICNASTVVVIGTSFVRLSDDQLALRDFRIVSVVRAGAGMIVLRRTFVDTSPSFDGFPFRRRFLHKVLPVFQRSAINASSWVAYRSKAVATSSDTVPSSASRVALDSWLDVVNNQEPCANNVIQKLVHLPLTTPTQKSVRVLCVVYTIADRAERVTAQFETWGRKCDRFVAFSSRDAPAAFAPLRQAAPQAKVEIIAVSGGDNKMNLWQKTIAMRRVIAKYDDLDELDAIFFGGDDVFVLLNNLRRYLAEDELQKAIRVNRRVLNIGLRLIARLPPFVRFTQGGGYLLTPAALRLLAKSHCEEMRVAYEEDQYVSHCLAQLQSKERPIMAVDERGEPLFNVFNGEKSQEALMSHGQSVLTAHWDVVRNEQMVKDGSALPMLDATWQLYPALAQYDAPPTGLNLQSYRGVSLHYVDQDEMRELGKLFYTE